MREVKELSSKEKALLNKIYRAAHDGVCPKCGFDLNENFREDLDTWCPKCGFRVTFEEMIGMSAVISEWGREAVEFFEEWRKEK